MKLSDRLWFDSKPYPKSFMSFVQVKDYAYIVITDIKVSQESLYNSISLEHMM